MPRFSSKVLTTKGSDIEQWGRLLHNCPTSDISFSPEYALLFESTKGETGSDFGGEARLFFYGNEENYVVYPFFQRRISKLPFAELLPPESKDWLDIVSPYGYSGHLACISEPRIERKLWAAFLSEFHDYCLLNNIIDEFARLNPFIKNHLPLQKLPGITLRNRGQLVYVDLKQNEPNIRGALSRGNKSAISLSRRNGVKISSNKTKDDISTFYQLYIQTMERNRAKKSYFFSEDFFHRLFELLKDNAALYNAQYQNRTIAAAIFLYNNNDLVHYYLGASDIDFLRLRPNNLLLYQAMLWAKGQGYRTFNFGGSEGTNYGLFRFKTSFSKTTTDFYTYSMVHDTKKYRLLCQIRNNYDKMTNSRSPKTDYFPQYRR